MVDKKKTENLTKIAVCWRDKQRGQRFFGKEEIVEKFLRNRIQPQGYQEGVLK